MKFIFKNKKTLFPLLFSVFLFLFSTFSFISAQEVNNLMENLVAPTPLLRGNLIQIIFTTIKYLLSFLGVIALLILIYGGFLWMTARGNEEQVKKAKKTIINGLIGLIIILLSYAIVSFVIGPLIGRGGEIGERLGPRGGPGGFPRGAQYLVITSRYPKPNETVPQNTKIIVTFNQNLDPNSVKLARPKKDNPRETSCVNENNQPIWTVAIQNDQDEFIDGSLKVINNSLVFTPKEKCPSPLDKFECEEREGENRPCSLSFKEDGCCGCFSPDSYKITLIAYRTIGNQRQIGLKGLRSFGNTMYRDEIWRFNVAPYIDALAPQVETNLPLGNRVPRNVGISVTFTKEIDLSTLKLYNPNCIIGSANCNKDNCNTDNCLNYAVDNLDEATVKIYKIENGNKIGIAGFFEKLSAKSFVFRPSTKCDLPNVQHCRCLPPLTEIYVELTEKIKGANCVGLDCSNGKCSWNFTTSDQVDLDPPEVTSTDPANNDEDVDRLLKIKAVFNESMDPTSINEDTFVLSPSIPPKEIKTEDATSTFTPSMILEPDTLYSPTIYGGAQRGQNSCNLDPDYSFGVKDLAGNTMVGNYIWRFRTGWLVNNGEPFIDWVSPEQGPKGQCVTIHGYNLGCCAPYECQDDSEAQKKKIEIVKIGKKKGLVCSLVQSSQFGKAFMWNETDKRYENARVLSWQEINKRKPCGPPPKPPCPSEPYCNSSTCPETCSECKFCSDPDPLNCGSCYCLMPAYSPENELVIVVPEKATNRPGNLPGQIKVVPAQ